MSSSRTSSTTGTAATADVAADPNLAASADEASDEGLWIALLAAADDDAWTLWTPPASSPALAGRSPVVAAGGRCFTAGVSFAAAEPAAAASTVGASLLTLLALVVGSELTSVAAVLAAAGCDWPLGAVPRTIGPAASAFLLAPVLGLADLTPVSVAATEMAAAALDGSASVAASLAFSASTAALAAASAAASRAFNDEFSLRADCVSD